MDRAWAISFVYAPSNRSQRKDFWQLLIHQAWGNRYPWLCMGDFNQVGSMWEKQGGVDCSRSQIDGFQVMLSECALMDLAFKGNAFTWTNNQVGGANIRKRLDKAFVLVEWQDKFPYAQVFMKTFLALITVL
ncbi:hypothetical protein LOK49_LG06G01971 [Camellia lanceoleosa]|uniref:Uncharacterized protein n=2 Tax=Camellia lanceoleosa TaxID=1840588 RepID=A0ACC0HEC5_9ERIC|nr:hypothetical protein LOK49_LG06G01975 [Camellia lanceoleosa]KAI8011992.1 hypothetical protein LOK49_LG06G01971 [Camellia lanceoleosa]